jgi:ectonucleotide pyrophosphatase/phosphodiesterase family protein 5
MYDPETNTVLQSWENLTNQWWPFKPIWAINQQRNGGLSGVIGWPEDSIYTSKFDVYQKDRSFKEIINQMLGWFNDPSRPINFGAIYFQEPDLTGRIYIHFEFCFSLKSFPRSSKWTLFKKDRRNSKTM